MTRARTRTVARGRVSPGTLKYRAAKDVTKRRALDVKGSVGRPLLDGSQHKATGSVAWPLDNAMTDQQDSAVVSMYWLAGLQGRLQGITNRGLQDSHDSPDGGGAGLVPHRELSEFILPKGAQTAVPSGLDSRVGGFWIGGCKACGACIRRPARSRRYHGGVAA